MYNGHIPNYTFNAPNKLFEYAVCGLDVWFPDQMISSMQYTTSGSYPEILAKNFQSLYSKDIRQDSNRPAFERKPHLYNCETVLMPLVKKLVN